MANRLFKQFRNSFLYKPVDLYVQFSVGAAGVATLSAAKSKGITSVTRGGSAGLYTVVLDDKYQRLLSAYDNIVIAAGTTSGVVELVVKADNSALAAQSVVLQFLSSAGAAADIANGAVVKLKLEFADSSLD